MSQLRRVFLPQAFQIRHRVRMSVPAIPFDLRHNPRSLPRCLCTRATRRFPWPYSDTQQSKRSKCESQSSTKLGYTRMRPEIPGLETETASNQRNRAAPRTFPMSGNEMSKKLQKVRMLTKQRKYQLLSRFPGRVGRRYQDKLNAIETLRATQRRFMTALQECTGLDCVDIGANVGCYTRTMAKYASHVWAFEPDPLAFDELTSSTKGLANVTSINACVGVSTVKTRLYRNKAFNSDPILQTQGSSMFPSSHLDESEVIYSDQVSVTQFIDDLDSEIGVIKIDAEGAEVPILESILERQDLLNRIRYIFVETHERYYPEWQENYYRIQERARDFSGTVIDLSWH